jgi:hypothetical protein
MSRRSTALWINRKNQLIDGLKPQYRFDSQKWRLGSLCKKFCTFPGTTQSLRSTYKSKSGVVVNHCACYRYGEDWAFKFLDQSSIGIDTSKYRLGNLCENNHNWKGTNKSLRWKNSSRCLECEALRRRNPEYMKSQAIWSRKWYKANKELVNEKTRLNLERRKQENPEAEKIKRTLNKHKRKARLCAAHTTHITDGQIKLHVKINYQGCCIYCGSKEKIVHDHFMPLAKGGPHVLGNIVPACNKCNCSKNSKDPKDWYFQQSFATKSGWQKILKQINIGIDENKVQLSLL